MNSKLENFLSKYHVLIAILLYSLITILFTLPVIFKINSEVPIWGSDVYQVIARIEDQLKIFNQLGFIGGLLDLAKNFQINIITFYSVPALFLGKFFSYNLMFLLSFILSGLGAYLLTFYFTKNKLASFLAGIIFAFSPFHLHQSLSVNVGSMHQEVIPFFVLFLFRFFEKFKFKFFVLVIVLGVLLALVDSQLFAFTILFGLIFLIYKIITNRSILKNKKFWIYIGSLVAFMLIAIFTLFLPLLKVHLSQDNFLNPGIEQAERYSIKFLDPITPPVFHSLWSGASTNIQNVLLGEARDKGSYFLGLLVIALFIYALVHLKKIKDLATKSYVKFWSIIALLFYIFSLGPILKIGESQIYLPYYLIYEFVPFFENIRTTGRFFVYVILAVSIVVAFAFIFLTEKYKSRTKIILASVFSLVFLLEFLAIPLKTESLQYSSFYDDLRQEKETFKILEIPGSTSYSFASFQQITNNVHGKEALNGIAFARIMPGEFDLQKTTPVLKQLLYKIPKGDNLEKNTTSSIINRAFYDHATEILNYYDVRYITLSKQYLDQEIIASTEKFIKENIASQKVFEDEFLIAYKIEPIEPQGMYITLNTESKHWDRDRVSKKHNLTYRAVDSGAPIVLVNMTPQEKSLDLILKTRSEKPRKVSLISNNQELANFKTNNQWEDHELNLAIPPGKNEIIIKVFDENNQEIFAEKKKREGVQFAIEINN